MKRGTKAVVKPKPVVEIDIDAPVRWRFSGGGGSFRLGQGPPHYGKIVKPNQTFTARPSEVPKVFQDMVKPLEKLMEKEDVPVVSSTEFRMEFWSEAEGVAYYNVVQGATSKPINEKPLPKEDAEKLLKDLS